jgi:hypothetical protein
VFHSNPAAGNGIFGCRDGKPKIGSKTTNVPRDEKSNNEPAIIPAKTASFESPRKSAVWKDWMVVCAVRYEPVSEVLTCSRDEKAEIEPKRPSFTELFNDHWLLGLALASSNVGRCGFYQGTNTRQTGLEQAWNRSDAVVE